MKTPKLLTAGLMIALLPSACVNQEPITPEHERHHDEDETTVAVAELRDLPSEDGFRTLPTVIADEPASRVAFLVTLSDELTLIEGEIEVRGRTGAETGDWMAIEQTFAEENLRVARAELDLFADEVDIRVTDAFVEAAVDITFATVLPDDLKDGQLGLDEVSEQHDGLAAELSAAGVVSRASWGARSSGNCAWESGKTRMAIHHTASGRKASGSYVTLVRALQNYAMDGLGYCEMHYHFLVAEDGTVYEGRPLHFRGSHSGGYNTNNIGIVLMGCFDGVSYCDGKGGRTVPGTMIAGAAKLVRALSDKYWIPINDARIKGHGQQPYQQTSCPGSYMTPRLDELRTLAAADEVVPEDPRTHVIFDMQGYFPTGSGFNSVGPARLVDTRQAGWSHLSSEQTIDIDVMGRDGIPSSGVSAVVLNLTVTQPSANGHMSVYPSGESFPGTSSLNFSAGQTTANLVIAKPGADGKVTLYNFGGTAHAVVDVFGYLSSSADMTVMTPARVLDTRNGTGGISGKLSGDTDIQLGGRGGVPSSGVAAVIANVTVTQPEAAGYATIYKDGQSRPGTSNVNYQTAQTKANMAIVPVSSSGKATLYTLRNAHYVIDVYGWIPPGGAFVPVNASRVHDSRDGDNPLVTDHTRDLQVTGAHGVPSSGVAAVLGNLTVTQPSGQGYLQAFPAGAAVPATSNLNFASSETVPNAAVVKPGSGGKIRIRAFVQ